MKINESKLLNAIFEHSNVSWGAFGVLSCLILSECEIDMNGLMEMSKEPLSEVESYLEELKSEGWISD